MLCYENYSISVWDFFPTTEHLSVIEAPVGISLDFCRFTAEFGTVCVGILQCRSNRRPTFLWVLSYHGTLELPCQQLQVWGRHQPVQNVRMAQETLVQHSFLLSDLAA